MTTTPLPETQVAQSETLEDIAVSLVREHYQIPAEIGLTPSQLRLSLRVLSALRNEREAERDRITSAIAAMYWHFDCGSERDTVLAIPHLPSCTCLAKDNHEATEYQHHHNSCPVYIRVTAIREGR